MVRRKRVGESAVGEGVADGGGCREVADGGGGDKGEGEESGNGDWGPIPFSHRWPIPLCLSCRSKPFCLLANPIAVDGCIAAFFSLSLPKSMHCS